MAHDVFISYAAEDKQIADAVCARLEQEGIRCWIAPRDIRPGADWGANIVSAIERSRALVLIFSAHANASLEIPKEVSQAAKRGLSIITFRIEDVSPAGSLDYNLNSVHWLDALTPPVEDYIDSLVASLKPLLQRDDAVEPTTKWDRQSIGLTALVFVLTSIPIGVPTGAVFTGSELASTASHVLPAVFFGLGLAMLTLPRWQERLLPVLASPIVYWAARTIGQWSYATIDFGGYIVAGVFGAAAMTLLLSTSNSSYLRAAPLAALTGAAGGAAFFAMMLLGNTLPGLAVHFLSYVAWQVPVGLYLVQFRWRRAKRFALSAPAIRSITIVAALCVIYPLATLQFGYRGLGVTLVTNPVDGLGYQWIEPGTFEMGCSPDDGECYGDETPAVKVAITKGFWIGETEVTVGAWKKVGMPLPPPPLLLDRNLNPEWRLDDLPLTNATWEEAKSYCERIGGRLPTEAEWEFAARAGTTTARYRRLDDIGVHAGNSGKAPRNARESDPPDWDSWFTALAENGSGPAPPKSKMANPWGLYDTLGNLDEWVEDDHGDRTLQNWSTSIGVQTDPVHRTGLSSAVNKVTRGGSWLRDARSSRASARMATPAGDRLISVGVRCVWNQPRPER